MVAKNIKMHHLHPRAINMPARLRVFNTESICAPSVPIMNILDDYVPFCKVPRITERGRLYFGGRDGGGRGGSGRVGCLCRQIVTLKDEGC